MEQSLKDYTQYIQNTVKNAQSISDRKIYLITSALQFLYQKFCKVLRSGLSYNADVTDSKQQTKDQQCSFGEFSQISQGLQEIQKTFQQLQTQTGFTYWQNNTAIKKQKQKVLQNRVYAMNLIQNKLKAVQQKDKVAKTIKTLITRFKVAKIKLQVVAATNLKYVVLKNKHQSYVALLRRKAIISNLQSFHFQVIRLKQAEMLRVAQEKLQLTVLMKNKDATLQNQCRQQVASLKRRAFVYELIHLHKSVQSIDKVVQFRRSEFRKNLVEILKATINEKNQQLIKLKFVQTEAYQWVEISQQAREIVKVKILRAKIKCKRAAADAFEKLVKLNCLKNFRDTYEQKDEKSSETAKLVQKFIDEYKNKKASKYMSMRAQGNLKLAAMLVNKEPVERVQSFYEQVNAIWGADIQFFVDAINQKIANYDENIPNGSSAEFKQAFKNYILDNWEVAMPVICQVFPQKNAMFSNITFGGQCDELDVPKNMPCQMMMIAGYMVVALQDGQFAPLQNGLAFPPATVVIEGREYNIGQYIKIVFKGY